MSHARQREQQRLRQAIPDLRDRHAIRPQLPLDCDAPAGLTIGLKRCYHSQVLNLDCPANGEFDAIKGDSRPGAGSGIIGERPL